MKKLFIALVLVFVIFALSLTGCSSSTSKTSVDTTKATNKDTTEATTSGDASSTDVTTATTAASATETTLKTFTATELLQYDGKNGNPAYVAVDGLVYDVTGTSKWETAVHQEHVAGTDLTSVMKDSPHGNSVMDGLTIVGTYLG